eukprot:CAMPEP_0198144584 /NCGR_PEP_ID=MMETSP1443-20131203/16661_1 /TAXON_ID=186043 /ORGANISM="Entomoneis sp., Strain CCMP2396" /LENGTH=319 /DNA_ID=CAMNT_0043807995 /DNA_START=77 /DNA_END=1036 /DNA_ORIENTATION=+
MKDIEAGVNQNNGTEKQCEGILSAGAVAAVATVDPLNNNQQRRVVEDPNNKKIGQDYTNLDESTTSSSSLLLSHHNSNNNNKANEVCESGGGGGRNTSGSISGSSNGLVEEPAPCSGAGPRMLPLFAAMAQKQQQQQQQNALVAAAEPKLIHPILLRIPLQFRFGLTGLMSNVLFMVVYNTAVDKMPMVQPPVTYAVVYFFFIPASHLMVSLLVFGWPQKRYLSSLISNFPIGMTALAIGGLLTAYLDQTGFNAYVANNYIRDFLTFTSMPDRDARNTHDEEGEFYSSILVLIVTSVWTYVLSVYVNSRSPEKSHKKEL